MSYWLERSVKLELMMLEVGFLMGLVVQANDFEVHKPDAHGNPVPSTMREILMKRIQDAVEEAKTK